jgi:Family of unknown function (DUF6197)
VRYSPNSTLIPTDQAELLRWAAAHIEHVGLNQNTRNYASSGPTRLMACSAYGALMVAAGDGRPSDGTTDSEVIRRTENEAFRILADHVHGQPVQAPAGWCIEDRHRCIVRRWSRNPSRTQEQVVSTLLEASALADASAEPAP